MPNAWLPEIIAHLTMTHGLFPYAVWSDVWVSFLGSAWSLSTEWQFYMLALLVFGQSRRMCWILLALAVAGMAWRLTVPIPWQFSRAFLPNKAHFLRWVLPRYRWFKGERGAILRYLVILAASLAICTTEGSLGKILPPVAWTGFLAVQMRPDLIGLRQAYALLSSRTARYFGAISYCVYLVNEPIHKMAGVALSWFAEGNSLLFTIFWIPLSIGLPLLAAAWLHKLLEAPALRWGREVALRWSADHGAATVQAPG